jgi:acetyl esterase/lipase
VQRDTTYCTVDGVDLKMDVYHPRANSQPTPLAVYVHGGGWTEGDKTDGTGLADAPALLEAGFTVASLDYRLAPQYKFPAMIEDVKCGIRALRARAADYGIDPDKIGVWGTSAGGHLVSLLGTTDASAGFDVGQYLDQSSRVQAVVDMFGPADLTVEFSGGYHPVQDAVFGGFDPAKASPITYITADDPPFLILQGDIDQTVPLGQSQEFHDRLAAGGIDARLVIVKNGPHGLVSPTESPSRAELTQMIVAFFKQHLQ